MSAYALELKDVSKNYPGFTLDHVSLRVPKGNIVGLIGENGAGKTTTIKIILNEVCKESGEVKVFGKDGATLEKKIRSDIGVVLDECLFPDIFTVNEIESFASKIYPVWEHQIYQSYIISTEQPTTPRKHWHFRAKCGIIGARKNAKASEKACTWGVEDVPIQQRTDPLGGFQATGGDEPERGQPVGEESTDHPVAGDRKAVRSVV
jgi:ABC-type sugar transport system ATPase subunit